jgi:lycopene beta-cyclase
MGFSTFRQLILRNLDLQPYQYNMVQGLDFLQSSFDFIFKKHQLCQSKVTDINELENHAYVATETDSYTCDTILIVFTTKREESQTKYPFYNNIL